MYNTLVTKLTENRKNLTKETKDFGNGICLCKMELLDKQFYRLAEQWNNNDILHLRNAEARKWKKINEIL